MALNAQEKFQKLLEQINYQDDSLTDGQVETVIVHQKSRVWEIHLQLPHVVPADTYRGLLHSLQMSFQSLANARVQLVIQTADRNASH